MGDEERRLYLAAATRLAQVAADPEASLSDLCHITSRAAFDLPHGVARKALEEFMGDFEHHSWVDDRAISGWVLAAAALKLRAQAEEAP